MLARLRVLVLAGAYARRRSTRRRSTRRRSTRRVPRDPGDALAARVRALGGAPGAERAAQRPAHGRAQRGAP
jgi:hypothetical protein